MRATQANMTPDVIGASSTSLIVEILHLSVRQDGASGNAIDTPLIPKVISFIHIKQILVRDKAKLFS